MVKLLANIVFSVFLNLFKRIDCDYNVRLSPGIFISLFKSKLKRVHLRNAIIGKGAVLSDGCSFFNVPEVFGKVYIGKNTSISGPSTRICALINEIKIGAYCSIASNVIIQEYYHNYNRTSTYFILSNLFGDKNTNNDIISKGPIVIEDDVWIGSNSVILSGVTIGRGAVIGAGSVVTKDVERYGVVAGNPAVKIKNRFSNESIRVLEESEWWLWDEEKMLANRDFFMVDRF